jgi:hypothetical protein
LKISSELDRSLWPERSRYSCLFRSLEWFADDVQRLDYWRTLSSG